MKKYLSVVIYCLMFSGTCFAQTMVLQDDRSKDSVISRFGPNMPKFFSLHLSGGLAASRDEDGGRIKYGTLGEIHTTLRWKYKMSAVYAMGFDIDFGMSYFKLIQEAEKRLPDSVQHHVERIDVYDYNVSYYNRFNFDPGRGNYLGNYLDLGISAGWVASLMHVMKDDIKTVQSSLPYPNKFRYDAIVRLGRNHVALYARYRFSDLFKAKYNYPELPRLMAGIELGIF